MLRVGVGERFATGAATGRWPPLPSGCSSPRNRRGATPLNRRRSEDRSLPSNRRSRSISTQLMDSLRFRNEIDPSAATAWQPEGTRWGHLNQNPFRLGTLSSGSLSGCICRNSFADNWFVHLDAGQDTRRLPFNWFAILPESPPPSTGILHALGFSGKISACSQLLTFVHLNPWRVNWLWGPHATFLRRF